VQLFSMICFGAMANVDHFNRMGQAENMVVIGAFAFLWFLFAIMAGFLNMEGKAPKAYPIMVRYCYCYCYCYSYCYPPLLSIAAVVGGIAHLQPFAVVQ